LRNTRHALESALSAFVPSMVKIYQDWTFTDPILVDAARVESMQYAQRCMLKLMTYIAENYSDVMHLLPHSDEIKVLLSSLQDIPFQPGTFRTDFVIGESNDLKLIEVTCRFPLNAFYRSAGMNRMIDTPAFEQQHDIKTSDLHLGLCNKLHEWLGRHNRLCIIQGEVKKGNESLFIPELLANTDIEVCVFSLDEWEQQWSERVSNSAIMAELTFEEWLTLPHEMVVAMLQQPFLNDPRLIFTVHDKAFFSLVNIEALTQRCFSEDESVFIKSVFAETYLPEQAPTHWEDAYHHQENWILKPRTLGKSEYIVAGALSDSETWLNALQQAQQGEFVLQRWYPSKRIPGKIGEKTYLDYFAGTLLYWGDGFFGLGMFRMSSYPISNVVDDRKATCLIATNSNQKTHPKLIWL
jgi:hypothetical protein